MQSSELILYLTIWGLTAAGVFFGGRSLWRRYVRHRKSCPRTPFP